MNYLIQKWYPDESLSAIKPKPDLTDLTKDMFFCGMSAKVACSCPCIIQRLC